MSFLSEDHRDYDGRPKVGWFDEDRLLDALIREHPELIPPDLVERLKADRGRVHVLAAVTAAAGGPPTP